MKKRLVFSLLALSYATTLLSQNVAINSTGAAPNASAMLDITSTTTGILIPRMTTAQRTAIAAPAQGLKVYDTTTNTFWYYNGTTWVEELSGTNGWMLAGNTLGGTEKLGSLNGQPVRFFSNNVQRMQINGTAIGEIVLNQPGAFGYFSGDMFSVYASGANYAVNGYATAGSTGDAGYFSSAGGGVSSYAVNTSTGWAAYGYMANTGNTRPGVMGQTANTSGTGLVGLGNGLAGYSTLVAGSGGAFTGSSFGLYSLATTAASGTGAAFAGNNGGVTTLAAGSGFAAQGTGVGGLITASTVASGTGIIGDGNGVAPTTIAGVGSGGAFNGVTWGVFARNTSLGTSGAIQASNGGATCYFDYYNGTQYKALSVGVMTVSCSVKDDSGSYHALHCPETPEYYFMDYGEGDLVNGKAHVSIDPLLAQNVTVNDQHPLRVYVQLEGECNGVYITNKTDTSFDVVELHGGTSNAHFQYHVVCNVADATYPNGKPSKFADIRFEHVEQPAPEAHPESSVAPANTNPAAKPVEKKQVSGGTPAPAPAPAPHK